MIPTDLGMIAVCGIDCAACPLYRAHEDREAAQILADWFHSEGWLAEDKGVDDVMRDGPYCRGCRGDREIHWDSECELLICCVDERELTHCHQCPDFVCDKLTKFAANGPQYVEALDRLRRLGSDRHVP